MAIIIKKKSLWIILLLIVMLTTYFIIQNYGGTTKENNNVTAVKNEEKDTLTSMSPEIEENFPEFNDENNEQNFFINYKLERDRVRSQEIEMLREIINNPNSEKHLREKAQQDLMQLVQLMEKEMILENLIKAKGFEDAIIFFTESSVNVIVKKESLSESEVAQISDIVSKGTGVSMDKIVIISRK